MKQLKLNIQKLESHNPYFNRWFSAIPIDINAFKDGKICHNPYFNRWFSAMLYNAESKTDSYVTILILIDGFLQS